MEKKSGKCTSSRSERISEAVVGIVVFASFPLASSGSLDKDPSWTPCGRSSCGTCWIWPMHLDKLHAPRKTWKTWKTSWWNYIRSLAHRIAQGNHTGQSGPIGPISKGLQQTAVVSPGKSNGERCKTPIPPKHQAASCGLLWPRRFMALLEIHLQGCECLQLPGV